MFNKKIFKLKIKFLDIVNKLKLNEINKELLIFIGYINNRNIVPNNSKYYIDNILNKIKLNRRYVLLFNEIIKLFEELDFIFCFSLNKIKDINYIINKYYLVRIKVIKLKLLKFLSEGNNVQDAILQISATSGGIDSYNWVKMLIDMYITWAERNSYKIYKINFLSCNSIGYRSIIYHIKGDYAFGYLRGETGIHRLIRISPFCNNNKRQTSFARVIVLPIISECNSLININYSDIVWCTFRSSGSGGQNVNKIESGVRLIHIPSNIIIENSETKSQLQNKKNALKLLRDKLINNYKNNLINEKMELYIKKKKKVWGCQIRNYIFHPYKLVKDLRTGYYTNNIFSIMSGNIEELISSYLNKYYLNN